MVGVPRSKACLPCRRKKKGCDLVRPVCGICQRQGTICIYQEKRWTFKSHKPAQITTTQNASLHRTALSIPVVDDFWSRCFPKDPPGTVYIPGVADVPWKNVVQEIAVGDSRVTLALRACAFMSLGRIGRNQGYVRYARQLYGQSLRDTNLALQDPVAIRQDETLVCCKLLGMFESFRLDDDGERRPSSQGTDWQRHVQGTCRIVELRGPATTPHSRDLFQDVRTNAAISGIVRRKTNDINLLFERDERQPKTLRDELMDIIATLPEVFERQDRIFASLSTNSSDAQNLLDICTNLSTRLQTWEHQLLSLSHALNPTTTPPTTLLSIAAPHVHGHALFSLITQFWLASAFLYTSTSLIHSRLSTNNGNDYRKGNMDIHMSPEPFVSAIAHTAHNFLSPSAGLWGAQVAGLPVGMALHYYAATGQGGCEEMRLLRQVMSKSEVLREWLRSMAADAGSGDTAAGAKEHQRMAKEWFGPSKRQDR